MFYEIQPCNKKAIISSDGTSLTYEELAEDIRIIGNHLAKRRIVF